MTEINFLARHQVIKTEEEKCDFAYSNIIHEVLCCLAGNK